MGQAPVQQHESDLEEETRHLVSINDLSNDEISSLFALADHFLTELGDPKRNYRIASGVSVASGRILASIFYEPSTRTRLSFESAMNRLGGQVITSADPQASSTSKGESLADTVRVVSNYADIIVLRHPRDGAARYAADFAHIPVVNGGDGGHEHPTQTLCDLYTLSRENKNLRDLNITISGDLKGSRTIHSLVYALARFGSKIRLLPAKGMELPSYVQRRLRNEFGGHTEPDESTVGAWYVTPDKPHQPTLFTETEDTIPTPDRVDAVYITRYQKERHDTDEGADYPKVDKQFMRDPKYSKTSVLHPLPRVDELGADFDTDRRAAYFRQAAYGVPVRMALMSLMLDLEPERHWSKYAGGFRATKQITIAQAESSGLKCPNPNCISREPSERPHIRDKFTYVDYTPPVLRCFFCETDIENFVVADKRHRRVYSRKPNQTTPANLMCFADEAQAEAADFTRS
ncbi:MAG: aspartate carbamoyltransferase catalytic subunit [Alphaproteobacteria bacterium]